MEQKKPCLVMCNKKVDGSCKLFCPDEGVPHKPEHYHYPEDISCTDEQGCNRAKLTKGVRCIPVDKEGKPI